MSKLVHEIKQAYYVADSVM